MQSISKCFKKVKKDYLKLLKKEKISNRSDKVKISNLKDFYIPLSFWIDNKYKQKGKTLFLGFSGGQGSGKTTISAILKIILTKFFKRKIYISSIDDFYKTAKERNRMSNKIHPLFKTRGVPGTHDINLIKKFFDFVKKKDFKKIKLPKFDKSMDDRIQRRESWYSLKKRPEIIILEGWCVGAKAQSLSLIKKPKNNLEKYEDKNLIWRKYVNERLKKDYKKLFNMIDHFIFMKIPNFKMVFKWRLLQEKKLKKKLSLNRKIMSYNEIKRFIMLYERITLQMLRDLSKSASIVMLLKKNHQIKKILFR
tara:strand:+ start:219 stop:1142 length:924 start_codon:yes stop_codon:yes gene_type:complete